MSSPTHKIKCRTFIFSEYIDILKLTLFSWTRRETHVRQKGLL